VASQAQPTTGWITVLCCYNTSKLTSIPAIHTYIILSVSIIILYHIKCLKSNSYALHPTGFVLTVCSSFTHSQAFGFWRVVLNDEFSYNIEHGTRSSASGRECVNVVLNNQSHNFYCSQLLLEYLYRCHKTLHQYI